MEYEILPTVLDPGQARCVVLTGTGDKAFCAGANFADRKEDDAEQMGNVRPTHLYEEAVRLEPDVAELVEVGGEVTLRIDGPPSAIVKAALDEGAQLVSVELGAAGNGLEEWSAAFRVLQGREAWRCWGARSAGCGRSGSPAARRTSPAGRRPSSPSTPRLNPSLVASVVSHSSWP